VHEFPGYTLLRTLGRGGMGIVYLAVQQSLGRQVALKVLTPAVAMDPASSERFLREARIEASLRHPHIVAVHDVGVHDGLPYMAMEYVPGGTLAELEPGADAVAVALRVVRDIGQALDFAHAHGVTHRDVKPENILRHVDGSFVLSDFGIARAGELSAFSTAEGVLIGTPHYMSPEQWRGEQVDGRSDLYSLGVVLHRQLTGRVPFHAEDSYALGHQHTQEPIPRLPPECAHVQGLLDGLMEKDRARRIQTGAEAARRAQSLLEGHTAPEIRTVELAVARAPAPAPARRRALVAVLAGLALLVFAGYAWRRVDGEVRATAPPKASIAVMPFTARSANAEDAYFAEGLGDELQGALTGVSGLMVAARNSAYAASQKSLDVKALGLALNVASVLNASVRREGSRVRILAQLSDTRTGFDLWSQSYDRELTDIFAVQREIAVHAARAVLGALPNDGRALAQRLEVTPDVQAYDAYLRGMKLLYRSTSDRNLGAAIEQFRAALAVDPRFARAQAAICTAELRRYENARETAALERAQRDCDRTAGLDPNLPELELARGDLSRARGDWQGAADHYQRALATPALRSDAHLGLARVEAARRQDAAAERHFASAREADPGDWRVFMSLGNYRVSRGRGEEAEAAFRNAIALAPEDATSPWNNLGALYYGRGDYARASDAFEHSVAIDATHSALNNLGAVQFSLGAYERAADLYRRATDLAPNDHRTVGNLADALSAAGDDQGAQDRYRRALEANRTWLATQPADAGALAQQAWYLANLGEARDARSTANRALAMEPGDADVLTLAAQVSARVGDSTEARDRIRKALAAGAARAQLAALPVLASQLAEVR